MRKIFTEEEKKFIIKKIDLKYIFVKQVDVNKGTRGRLVGIKKNLIRCTCENGLADDNDNPNRYCKYCGNYVYYGIPYIMDKDSYDKALHSVKYPMYFRKEFKSSYKTVPFYFAEVNKDDELELLIHRCHAVIDCDEHGNDRVDIKIMFTTIFKPGVGLKGYKVTSKKCAEVDPFVSLGLNSRTSLRKIAFKDCEDLDDFIKKNPRLCKLSGIEEFQKSTHMWRNGGLLVYLGLYHKYPVVELLLKMGYGSLIESIYNDLRGGCSAAEISDKFSKLNKLLNEEATKGSKSLKIPKYISDFLNKHKAGFKVYYAFCDFYQLDKTLSKENFEELSKQIYFSFFFNKDSNYARYYKFDVIADLMTYGYKLNELLKYLYENAGINDYVTGVIELPWYKSTDIFFKYNDIISYLYDYRHMCDVLNIEAQKFPKNLVRVHDALYASFEAKQNEIYDKDIGDVAEKYSSIAIDFNKKPDNSYLIKLPVDSGDLIKEGQSQHNCVGSYIRTVASKQTVVFFIRKKEEPDSSFVTAEYRHGRVNQLYYRNNRPVYDETIRSVAQTFVDKARTLDRRI